MDTITYTKNVDGTISKTVVASSIINLAEEIGALKAQLEAFQVPADTPENQTLLDNAILNYKEQLGNLQTLIQDQEVKDKQQQITGKVIPPDVIEAAIAK